MKLWRSLLPAPRAPASFLLMLALPRDGVLPKMVRGVPKTSLLGTPPPGILKFGPDRRVAFRAVLAPGGVPMSPLCESAVSGFGLTWQCRPAQRQVSQSSGSSAQGGSCFHAPPCGRRTLSGERCVWLRTSMLRSQSSRVKCYVFP